MTTFQMSAEVCASFPQARVGLLAAWSVSGERPWPAVTGGLSALEAAFAAGQWSQVDETDQRVASWHEAYRQFGTNPRRVRPSLDTLGRRLVRRGDLPRISSAVDAYNLVSVRHGFPAGAFDLDRLDGDVVLRPAGVAELFVPLGEPDNVEQAKPGEIVYADDRSVITRHWNHRDSDRTKVTAETRRVVFLLETLRGDLYGDALTAAMADLRGIVDPHAEATDIRWLDADRRTARLALIEPDRPSLAVVDSNQR